MGDKQSKPGHITDHLANERTFLAWLRSGISMMGFGIVIAKLRHLFLPNNVVPPSKGLLHASHIGLLFTFIGLATVVFATQRTISTQKEIDTETFRPHNTLIVGIACVVIAMGVGIVWYLLQD